MIEIYLKDSENILGRGQTLELLKTNHKNDTILLLNISFTNDNDT
jgi:hypothetical protein